MPEGPWIETARERIERIGEGAAPNLTPACSTPSRDEDPDPAPDPREDWLARLGEVFPPGAGGEPVRDWAGVSRRTGGPWAGEHRIQTGPSKLRALARLAGGVVEGWAPLLVVDLRSGGAWRASLTCHAHRRVSW